jgi:hypothetical protein
VLAAQKSTSYGVVADDANAFLQAGERIPFEFAVQNVVARLDAIEACVPLAHPTDRPSDPGNVQFEQPI